MMNTALCHNWIGFSASVPGSGHIRRGLPCQDASAAVTSPRPALIVCDGRGSASASQEGANAAIRHFLSQLNVFEPMLSNILDTPNVHEEQWQVFARVMYRELMQVKLDLAAERQKSEKEFDFTVAFAVIGTHHIGCFQVGDGAIVLRQNGTMQTAFPPDKGEFANQTSFLREDGERAGKYHAALFSASENTGVAITSDGPEYLMFKLNGMQPGKIFTLMMDNLHDKNFSWEDLMDYLTRRAWEDDQRGSDDRSVAILAPLVYPVPAHEQPEQQNIRCIAPSQPRRLSAPLLVRSRLLRGHRVVRHLPPGQPKERPLPEQPATASAENHETVIRQLEKQSVAPLEQAAAVPHDTQEPASEIPMHKDETIIETAAIMAPQATADTVEQDMPQPQEKAEAVETARDFEAIEENTAIPQEFFDKKSAEKRKIV